MSGSAADDIFVLENPDTPLKGDLATGGDEGAAAASPPMRSYDFSTSTIDALLGAPALMIGENMATVRALENAMSEDMADLSRPQSYVDIRAKASAIREAAQLERDRVQLLNQAIKEEVAAAAGAHPGMVRQFDGFVAGRSFDRIKLDRLLGKAGLEFDSIAARAMARVRLQYEALSAMIDRAHKKAREAETHAWRREEKRMRIRLLRKKAQDANALNTFD